MNTKLMTILVVGTYFALNFVSASAQDSLKKDSTKKDAVRLREVAISGKKAMIQYKIDRTVVNVDAMISSTGANALDVLEKSPGVIVDQNGNITFMGKSGVTILIDSKPTYLSAENLASYLKSLSAAQLEEIELMSNPPAKYDASGTAGVINIKTKKQKSPGLNGSLALSLGKTDNWRNSKSLIFNYSKGKINLFSSFGHSFTKTNKTLELERNYFDANGGLIRSYKQKAYFRPKTDNINTKLGLDYYLSPRTTLGVQFTGSLAPGNYRSPVNTILFSPSGQMDSVIIADNTAKSRFNNSGVNLSFITKLDSAGAQLSVDADRIAYSGKNNQQFLNSIYFPSGLLKDQQGTLSNLPADIQIYSLKSDYVYPLANKTKLDLGGKTSYVSTDNFAGYLNLQNGQSTIDPNKTNRFRYKEQINSGYLNFSREISRLSLQGGLRLEHTQVRGIQSDSPIRQDSAFRQNYLNLFPTAYLSYKLDSSGNNSLNFSYGRRIDRPYYKDLNPFIYMIDKYTYSSGNSLLQPQATANYELSWRHRGFLSTTAFYNRYHNFQTETVKQTGGIFISTPANLGEKTTLGINTNALISPAKWWDGNIYTELVNLKFTGTISNTLLNTSTTYFYVESAQQFKFSDTWSAELNGFYISGRTVGQFRLDGKSQLNAGIQKKLIQSKAILKLAASDIFRRNISSGTISDVAGATAAYRNDFDTRTITLGISYNFGSKTAAERKKNGSAQNEQNRVRN